MGTVLFPFAQRREVAELVEVVCATFAMHNNVQGIEAKALKTSNVRSLVGWVLKRSNETRKMQKIETGAHCRSLLSLHSHAWYRHH